jgi:flagellar biogenesis protein FliO
MMLKMRGNAMTTVIVVVLAGVLHASGKDDVAGSRSTFKLPRPEILPPLNEPSIPASIQTDLESEAKTNASELKRPAEPRSHASNSKSFQTVSHPETGAGVFGLADMIPLVAVLALIGVAAFVVKRFMPAKTLLTGAGVLDVVARLSLSPKQTLILVKMGKRLVLLGMSGESMTALSEVTDPEQVAFMLGQAASESSSSMTSTFARSIQRESLVYEDEDEDFDEPEEMTADVRGLLDKVRHFTRIREVA